MKFTCSLSECFSQNATRCVEDVLSTETNFNPKIGCIPAEEFEVIRAFEAGLYRSVLHEHCHPDIAGVVLQYLLETIPELLCQLFNVIGNSDNLPNIKDFDSVGLQMRVFSSEGVRSVSIVGWENLSNAVVHSNSIQNDTCACHPSLESRLFWWQIWCRDELEDYSCWQRSSDSLRCVNVFWFHGKFVLVPLQAADIDLYELTHTYLEQDGTFEERKEGVLDYLHESLYPTVDDSMILLCDRWRLHEILCANVI